MQTALVLLDISMRHLGLTSASVSYGIQGGGWCNDVSSCVLRKGNRRGSSNHMERQLQFTGIMSNRPEENPGILLKHHTVPLLTKKKNIAVDYLVVYLCCAVVMMFFFCLLDFYNWNRVKVRYCDGGSFTGDGSKSVSEILSQFVEFYFLSFTKY